MENIAETIRRAIAGMEPHRTVFLQADSLRAIGLAVAANLAATQLVECTVQSLREHLDQLN